LTQGQNSKVGNKFTSTCRSVYFRGKLVLSNSIAFCDVTAVSHVVAMCRCQQLVASQVIWTSIYSPCSSIVKCSLFLLKKALFYTFNVRDNRRTVLIRTCEDSSDPLTWSSEAKLGVSVDKSSGGHFGQGYCEH
jgi:hypothetical protein